MTFASATARWLGCLAFSFLSCAGAQTIPPNPEPQTVVELVGQRLADQLLSSEPLPATLQRFEQAWDVVELMGQPMLSDAQRLARVLIRPQGSLWVDGGCNYFSGRIERDAQGLFRVSKYGGTHGSCEKPPRSEALLNSALVMVDNYRWDRGLVLRNGDSELVRLMPSANQDGQEVEQALASRAEAAAAPAHQAAGQNCHQVKAAQPSKARTKGRRSSAPVHQVCKPVKAAAGQVTAKVRASKGKPVAKVKSSRPVSRPKSGASTRR